MAVSMALVKVRVLTIPGHSLSKLFKEHAGVRLRAVREWRAARGGLRHTVLQGSATTEHLYGNF